MTHVAWYDREIAAVLFEPTRVRLEAASADNPAELAMDFVAWSLFDPRAAAARLEQLPFTSDPVFDNNAGTRRGRSIPGARPTKNAARDLEGLEHRAGGYES